MWCLDNDKFLSSLVGLLLMVAVLFSTAAVTVIGPAGAILVFCTLAWFTLKNCWYWIDEVEITTERDYLLTKNGLLA